MTQGRRQEPSASPTTWEGPDLTLATSRARTRNWPSRCSVELCVQKERTNLALFSSRSSQILRSRLGETRLWGGNQGGLHGTQPVIAPHLLADLPRALFLHGLLLPSLLLFAVWVSCCCLPPAWFRSPQDSRVGAIGPLCLKKKQ